MFVCMHGKRGGPRLTLVTTTDPGGACILIYIHIYIVYSHAFMFVCMIVREARANQRHTRHHQSSRVCECDLHGRVCELVECVSWHYFANPSTLSACLSVHVRPCVLMLIKYSTLQTTTRNTHTHRRDESPAKMSAGRVDNLLPRKSILLYRGETES
jgi:hypothetical protein